MKTNDSEQTVRRRILEAAKAEFLEYGYEKASLRKICAKAGVTTGALYFFFHNKQDVFEQVVRGTVDQLGRLTKGMIERELEDTAVGVENEKLFLDFCWKNREVIMILYGKSAGTGYERFREELQLQLEDTYVRFFEKYSDPKPDRGLIHILVRMKIQSYIDILTGGYTLERTRELAEKIGWYTDGGFVSLMEKLNTYRTDSTDRM